MSTPEPEFIPNNPNVVVNPAPRASKKPTAAVDWSIPLLDEIVRRHDAVDHSWSTIGRYFAISASGLAQRAIRHREDILNNGRYEEVTGLKVPPVKAGLRHLYPLPTEDEGDNKG
jgi:hypothetical protein